MFPTGSNSSSQIFPVERAHRTVSNGIKSCLISAELPIAYWPFAFLHVLRIRNTFPGNGQGSSPIHLLTGKKDNLKNLRTFDCRVWVRTPEIQAKRFKDEAKRISSLDMFYISHEISFGMTSSLNNVKLEFTVYLMKDSMMFL